MSQQDAQPNLQDTAVMPEKMELTSLNIADHQKQKLKELFPEVFTEGNKIDFDQLKRTLGEMVDGGKERFGMQWAGKADCFKTIQQPSLATLVPCPEESIDFDTTENVFIEGDNLEVLKLLQKSYLGKIKMIYIDPPYNTGNDFIYPDNYSENLDTYLEYTGQIDGEGRKFSTNTDTDGRFHSKWMNMMYPRLFLAKNLLREDGIIFISIDDSEVKNLRSICDEIFGEENFISEVIWKKSYGGGAKSKHVVSLHEHILMYTRSKEKLGVINLPPNPDVLKYYKFSDEKFDIRGPYRKQPLATNSMDDRPNLRFPIFFEGHEIWPEKQWQWSKERVEQALLDNSLVIQRKNNGWTIDYKQYLKNEDGEVRGSKLYSIVEGIYTQVGTDEIKSLFGNGKIFNFPKPSELIKTLIGCTDKNSIVLDFFAGSATTAHAVMALNNDEGGNRKFICVQLPEPTDEKDEAFNAGYKTIAEVSKERIRRAAAKIKAEASSNTDLLTEEKASIDLGFRVFKLQKSNFSVWDSSFTTDADQIALQLEGHVDHISPEAEQQAILFELLLKAGFELTTPIDTLTLADKTVYSIAEGALLICLEKQLTLEVMHAIADLEPSRVIVLDEGFQNNDQLKTNASLTLKSKGILDFRTV